jgi:chromosome segregation ATPase
LELLEQLNQNQMLMAVAGLGFVVGAILMRTVTSPKEKVKVSEDPRNHRIREMEANLRTTQREFADIELELEEKTADLNTAVETLQGLRANIAEREEELAKLTGDLNGSVMKTRELRIELQDRATETIREQVRAEEAETELDIARAGSEAVLSEISRLQEERKSLTDSMRSLDIDDPFLADEDLFGEDVSKHG